MVYNTFHEEKFRIDVWVIQSVACKVMLNIGTP